MVSDTNSLNRDGLIEFRHVQSTADMKHPDQVSYVITDRTECAASAYDQLILSIKMKRCRRRFMHNHASDL